MEPRKKETGILWLHEGGSIGRRCKTVGCKAEKTKRENKYCSVCQANLDRLDRLVKKLYYKNW